LFCRGRAYTKYLINWICLLLVLIVMVLLIVWSHVFTHRRRREFAHFGTAVSILTAAKLGERPIVIQYPGTLYVVVVVVVELVHIGQ
jgi:hypothetical protein